jgi:hypothetical protein
VRIVFALHLERAGAARDIRAVKTSVLLGRQNAWKRGA